ncbi:hypothetical protein HK104_007240, partial [Borealophlyctis nickersoniae]
YHCGGFEWDRSVGEVPWDVWRDECESVWGGVFGSVYCGGGSTVCVKCTGKASSGVVWREGTYDGQHGRIHR